MKQLTLGILLFSLATAVWASGEGEDQSNERTFPTGDIKTVEIDGQVTLFLTQGPEGKCVITSNRGLFDQLKVENWNGNLWIHVDMVLFGPREPGEILVKLQVKSLSGLVVKGASSAKVELAVDQPFDLAVSQDSRVEGSLRASRLGVKLQWNSQVKLRGEAGFLKADITNRSSFRGEEFLAKVARLDLGNVASAWCVVSDAVSGVLKDGSRLTVVYDPRLPPPLTDGVEERGNSVLDVKPWQK